MQTTQNSRNSQPDYTATELAAWCTGQWSPAPPPEIAGVTQDTRTIQSGHLYVALKGKNHDGHDFLDQAFIKGAAGAVVSEEHSDAGTAEHPVLCVEDTARALREMAAAYRDKVNPHIIAVTGSAGKSTVKEMTAAMTERKGPTARTRGNWNNDIGLPLSLLAMPAGTQFGVFEIGMNHPGEIENLCRILKPSWGIVTNIGPVHMEFFKSIDDIAREKASLLRSLPADGTAFINRDGGIVGSYRR
jgi:UDP-N-acetylmuramoyl-tripeptide--D-alanyl-D-alanine ligase